MRIHNSELMFCDENCNWALFYRINRFSPKSRFLLDFIHRTSLPLPSLARVGIKDLGRPTHFSFSPPSGNYSVTGFEMVLTRRMSHYMITYYLPR